MASILLIKVKASTFNNKEELTELARPIERDFFQFRNFQAQFLLHSC